MKISFGGVSLLHNFFVTQEKKPHNRQIENRDPTLFIMYITDINTMFWIVEVDYDVDQNQEWIKTPNYLKNDVLDMILANDNNWTCTNLWFEREVK